MVIVDTHCHVGVHKYEPVEVLLFHMAQNGVAQAVFIQYMGNTDNRVICSTVWRPTPASLPPRCSLKRTMMGRAFVSGPSRAWVAFGCRLISVGRGVIRWRTGVPQPLVIGGQRILFTGHPAQS